MAFGYPIALDLAGRRALVVGANAVAQGKVEGLLDAGATVKVVADGPAARLAALEGDERVTVAWRAFRARDLSGAFVCVASSEDPAERAFIHAEAKRRGVLVNVMDDPPHCDFAAPAVVRRGDLVIAVSTGGRSPALARRLREELEGRFGKEWKEIVEILGEARDRALSLLPDYGARASRWHEALDLEELERLVRDGQAEQARRNLLERLVGSAVGA